jgi:hypothetical protein
MDLYDSDDARLGGEEQLREAPPLERTEMSGLARHLGYEGELRPHDVPSRLQNAMSEVAPPRSLGGAGRIQTDQILTCTNPGCDFVAVSTEGLQAHYKNNSECRPATLNAKGTIRKRVAEACSFCRRRKVCHLDESPHQAPAHFVSLPFKQGQTEKLT